MLQGRGCLRLANFQFQPVTGHTQSGTETGGSRSGIAAPYSLSALVITDYFVYLCA